jgi:signal recognition particle subunit SRP54
VGREVRVPVFAGKADAKPLELALGARDEARAKGADVLLVDTAGRLHIDEDLMRELVELRDRLEPVEILFVADAMTGQDAVRSAEEFHRNLSVTGVILTKLDGDARGGAALSVRSVTGQAIKFVGTGEKLDNLELFHPDRMASRILGMGDVLTLIEKAEEAVDRKQAQEMAEKLVTNKFSLEDFREQIKQAKKMGPLSQVMAMLPSMGPLGNIPKEEVDDESLVRVEAILNSMTARERVRPEILNGSRRKRIARGSGTTVQEVNQLMKQYDQMRRMMRGMRGRFGRFLKQQSAAQPGAQS